LHKGIANDFYKATPFRNPPKRENCTPGYSLHKLSFVQLHRHLPVQVAAATRPRDRCLFLLMFRHRPHVSEVCGLNPQTAIETSDGPAAAQAQNGIFGAKWLRRYNPRDFDDWRTAPLHPGVHQAGDKVSAIELAR
jgi:hypothetical protein